MRTLLQSSVVALMFFSTSSVLAQPRELKQDRVEQSQTRHETRDDQRDRAQAATLLRRYDEAVSHRRGSMVRALDAEALRLMDRELSESRREVRQDAKEVYGSHREVHDGRYAGGPPARAETRDDVRDLRDDKRDLRAERKDLEHVRAIRADFAALRDRTGRVSLMKKRGLLADFLARSNRELSQNEAERREDRRERREDLREAHR
jgi:hypothetical protein